MKNKVRLVFQLFFLSAIGYVAIRPLFDKAYIADFEKYCPFGGISSFFSKLQQDTMACSMSETQVMLGIGLLLGAGLIGKLFCSYICPIGSISEWIGKLGEKFGLRRDITGITDRLLRGMKYILLFVTVYITMSSSELFCKKFDPYFAVANGFQNSDILLWAAIPAVLITIAGSFFFRMFWCKYLCPLGAFSNVFLNIAAATAVIAVYFTLNYFGAGLNFVWLLGGLTLAGWINESGFMRSWFMPLPKVTRDEQACSNCGHCDVKCPQGIPVSKLAEVRHIDCNLCTDCVFSCPLKQVITIKKKKSLRYLAPVMVVVLIMLSLGAAELVEFSTVSVRWNENKANEAVYTQNGIKTITCYGSSMALVGSLEGIEGINGVDTYAKSQTVKIYYQPDILSVKAIKELLFTPQKVKFYVPEPSGEKKIGVLSLGILGFFDAVDYTNLSAMLRATKAVVGLQTSFGEPVKATIYFEAEKITPQKIIACIEQKSFELKGKNGTTNIPVDFTVRDKQTEAIYISTSAYLGRMFDSFEHRFSRFDDELKTQYRVYVFPFAQAVVDTLQESLALLSGHLSMDEGIVGFATRYNGSPQGEVIYHPEMTNIERIERALRAQKISYYISDTETETVKNPFQITEKGKDFGLKDWAQ